MSAPRGAGSGSAWKGSASRWSRRRRVGCRSSGETRAACRTRCATGRRASSCRRRSRRRWSRRCVGCSTTPRWRGASAPRGAARSRPTTTGIASSATSAPSNPKWWGRGRLFHLPPSPFPVLNPTLLLAFNFPPHGGGIARMMGEIALRYPAGSLVVSTGAYANSAASDARFPHPVDRVAIRATRLRTLNGLVLWTARASRLARRHVPGFVWCAELKPAAYPARWLNARRQLPYGIVVHGTELLLLDEKTARSAFKRWTGRQLFAGCAVVVANSRWTAERARALLTALGCGALARDVRAAPPGTTPTLFRPGIDPRPIRAKHGLEGGPWLLTVSRLDWHRSEERRVGKECRSRWSPYH